MPTATLGIRDRAQADLGAETDGEIVPPTEVKIVDASSGATVADGEEGEILVRGPELFVGLRAPRRQRRRLRRRTATSAWATSAGACTGATSSSPAARRTSSSARARTSARRRSRTSCSTTPPSPTWRSSRCRAATTGEKGCAFIIPRPGRRSTCAEIRRFLDARRAGAAEVPRSTSCWSTICRACRRAR